MTAVTLVPLAPADHDSVRHLEVLDAQLAFVATIDQMLSEPTPGVDFHAIRGETVAVGFFKIDRPGVSAHDYVGPEDIGLRGLLIGAQYQGTGYGRAFAAALPAYLAANYTAPRATLSVDESNPVARRLYLSGGWQETGEIAATRAGPARVLQLDLTALR